MNKKATLLIKNLEAIYSMDPKRGQDGIVYHAYIAIHHDQILKIDQTLDPSIIDKDTRIIDARGHFAIPAFIEAKGNIEDVDSIPQALQTYHERMNYFHHGILTIAHIHIQNELVETEVVPYKEHASYPLVDMNAVLVDHKKFTKKQFCITTYDAMMKNHDSLLIARMLYRKYHTDAMTLLKAMSLYPARRLGLSKLGMLKEGFQADFLLCQGKALDDLFSSFDGKGFDQVIKRGIRVFPSILRS